VLPVSSEHFFNISAILSANITVVTAAKVRTDAFTTFAISGLSIKEPFRQLCVTQKPAIMRNQLIEKEEIIWRLFMNLR